MLVYKVPLCQKTSEAAVLAHSVAFWKNIDEFDVLSFVGAVSEDKVRYCERFIELLIDLESQLLTRRFFNTVVDDAHVLVRSRLSALSRQHDDDAEDRQRGRLFQQLVDMLGFYATFEICEETGEARTDSEMTAIHYNQITSLQVKTSLSSIFHSFICQTLVSFHCM